MLIKAWLHKEAPTAVAVQSPNDNFLRSKEVAWILDCSPDDVIGLARKGSLKAFKEGRFWRYREADVMAYKRRMES